MTVKPIKQTTPEDNAILSPETIADYQENMFENGQNRTDNPAEKRTDQGYDEAAKAGR